MVIDIKLIGSRVRIIREQVLKITQMECAKILNSKQSLISRLEAGKGSNINTILDFLMLLQKMGYPAESIFSSDFNIKEFGKKETRGQLLAEKKHAIVRLLNEI